jgi:cell division protein FtsQ|tara:strand:+ start:3299 stop:3970 length:672 start_codon:yes stop_codon:yes gene_type:complete
MHLRKSKKILIYLLLFFLVGSINNIELSKINLSNISKIKISGLGNENNKSLSENIKSLKLGNIFLIKKNKLINLIESNSLVENYDIFKVYPSSLYINIQKTKFLARINHNGINYIVGSNGKLSKNNLYDENLPFIFGKPRIDEFLRFKKIIDLSKLEYKEIKNLYFFPTGRWDIEFDNNVLIKLSEKNVEQNLELVYEFLNNNNFGDIKIIDVRIENQIILNG